MKIQKKKIRRCDSKLETTEGKLLKYLRESRNLSVRAAGKILGMSESSVSHAEHGRRDLDQKVINSFLTAYGYSFAQFQQMLNGNLKIPEHLRSECMDMIQRLDESKLKTVKAFLMTF